MKDKIYRFAGFELSAIDGDLRSNESLVHLQDKPLLLLRELLDHPQTLVTRQQLRERMWGSGTFVDFEQGINVAIRKLREALGDSAENPKFIQTVAKKGYRFLPPVEVLDTGEEEGAPVALPSPITPAEDARHRGWLRLPWVLAVVVGGTLALSAAWFFVARKRGNSATPIHSLAVLPLRNLSPDPGQEYFAEGVTEDLITNLAESLPLRVISRTSVMRYQDTNKPIAQIARELGVEGIIEGSVARAGKRVTVTVQLIDATEDTHLWAHRYDRDAEDLLEIEGEVSQEISNQIGGALGLRRGTNAATAHRIDPEVYDLYLLGRYHRNKRTAADLTKALDFFQQSINRDPRYAPAYAGLASVYGILPHYQSVDVQDTQRKAEAAARHALELDDDLAEAHATLGLLDVINGAPEGAPGEFRRAIELNPSEATAHQWYAYYFLFSNQPNEALQEMELARRLDPLSAIINADEGQFLYGARRYEAAKARLREAIELAPELAQPHETLGLIEVAEGRSAEAMREARVGLRLDPDDPRTMGEAGYVLAKGGQVREARSLLVALNGKLQRGSGFPTYAAFIYVGLGEREKAVQTLEKMAKERPASLSGLPQLTVLDELKDDPRYRKLCTEAQQMKY